MVSSKGKSPIQHLKQGQLRVQDSRGQETYPAVTSPTNLPGFAEGLEYSGCSIDPVEQPHPAIVSCQSWTAQLKRPGSKERETHIISHFSLFWLLLQGNTSSTAQTQL